MTLVSMHFMIFGADFESLFDFDFGSLFDCFSNFEGSSVSSEIPDDMMNLLVLGLEVVVLHVREGASNVPNVLIVLRVLPSLLGFGISLDQG